ERGWHGIARAAGAGDAPRRRRPGAPVPADRQRDHDHARAARGRAGAHREGGGMTFDEFQESVSGLAPALAHAITESSGRPVKVIVLAIDEAAGFAALSGSCGVSKP